MSHPDRSIGFGGQPDGFAGIVSGLFEVQEAGRLSAEISGFKGPYAGKIAQWQSEGIGRLIGAPLTGSPTGKLDQGTNFRSMIYALPYTDETVTGFDQKVLLVFPSEEGLKVNLVKPKATASTDEYDKARADENTLAEFSLLFTPHDKPAFVDGWNPDPKASSYGAFLSDKALFFPVEILPNEGIGPEAMLEKAVDNARRKKKRQHVNELRVDDSYFDSILDPDAVNVLFEVSKGMDLWEQGKDIDSF